MDAKTFHKWIKLLKDFKWWALARAWAEKNHQILRKWEIWRQNCRYMEINSPFLLSCSMKRRKENVLWAVSLVYYLLTWRYRSCKAAGDSDIISEASLKAPEAFFSPSAAITFKIVSLKNCFVNVIRNWHLSPCFSGSFCLCSHGPLQLFRQTSIFTAKLFHDEHNKNNK